MKNCNIFTAKPISLAIITIIQYPRNNLTGSVAKEQNKSDHLLIRAYLPLSSFFPEPSNLVSFGTKEEKVVLSNLFSYFNIRTIQGPNQKAAIHRKLHIASSAGLHPSSTTERKGRKKENVSFMKALSNTIN
jgi:hypothetical protein